MKKFILIGLAFGLLLVLLFNTFLFDSSFLLVNLDQLNGLGSRFLRVHDFFMTQWDDSRLGGVPTIDALFGDAYHPLVLTQWIFDPARAVGFKFIACVWIAFLSTYALIRKVTGRWEWAALLGLLFALNPQFFTHIYGGHDGKMMVFSIAPLAILGLILIIREGKWIGFFLFALSLVWMILSSHLQLTYLFLWGAGLFTLFESFRIQQPQAQRFRRMGVAAAALALGLGLTAVQILPPLQYTTQQSVRGSGEHTTIAHAASWSLHPEELASMLIPGFLHPNVHDDGDVCPNPDAQGRCNCYWGHNSFKLNQDSAGIVLTFLAFLGLFIPSNRKAAIFWLLGAGIALSYALGANSPLFDLWYNILPGVKNFRAPSMAIFWIPLAMTLMAAPVLDALQDKAARAKLLPGAILFAGLLALVTLARFSWDSVLGIPGAVLSVVFGALIVGVLNQQDRAQPVTVAGTVNAWLTGLKGSKPLEIVALMLPFLIIALEFISYARITTQADLAPYFRPLQSVIMNRTASDILPSAFLCFVSIGIAFFAVAKMKRPQAALVLTIVALLELLIVNLPYIQELKRSQYVNPENSVLQAIIKDSPDPLTRPRILSMSRDPAISGNIFAAYGMRGANGFHDNELASSRAFREELFQIRSLDELRGNPYIDLYHIGYFIWDSPQGTQVMRTSTTMSEAVLFGAYQVMPAQAMNPALAKGFDFHRILLLEEEPSGLPAEAKFTAQATSARQIDTTLSDSAQSIVSQLIANAANPRAVPGKATLTASSRMDQQTFSVEAAAPALLFVSGNYHPYWKACIDGKDTKVLRAFGNFRAVVVPAGKHQVEFAYHSEAIDKSMKIVYISLLVLLILVIAYAWKLRKKKI